MTCKFGLKMLIHAPLEELLGVKMEENGKSFAVLAL